jgi:isopenicillin N synthase-like dioxygenase
MRDSNGIPVPVVDLSAWQTQAGARQDIIRALRDALENCGFAYVRGLPLPESAPRSTFSSAWRFFQAPESFKRRFAYAGVDANFGYQALEGEKLDPGAAPDLKESFTMRNAASVAMRQDVWPDEDFRRIATSFYSATLDAARLLLQIMAASLELPQDFFVARHTGENVTLRYLHYPAGLKPRSPTQLGAGAHTDYGSITLLFQGEIGGLEVQGADGQWRPAPPMPGCAILNTGDLMERWTNGRFTSTLHRVQPIAGARDRLSIALFVDPDSDVKVECIPSCRSATHSARQPPVTAGEHIRSKIAATHEVRT